MYWLLWFDSDSVQLNRMARSLQCIGEIEVKEWLHSALHAALVCIEGQRLGENCSGHHRLLRTNFSDSDSGDCVCVRHSGCRTVQFLSCV